MFETYPEAEIFIPNIFGKVDESRLWAYVEKRLSTYWFHVVVSPTDPDYGLGSKIFFLDRINDLAIISSDETAYLSDLKIVTPGHMNGSDNWKMESLVEILVGSEPDIPVEQQAFVFVTDGGLRYVDSSLGTPEKRINDLTSFWKLQN